MRTEIELLRTLESDLDNILKSQASLDEKYVRGLITDLLKANYQPTAAIRSAAEEVLKTAQPENDLLIWVANTVLTFSKPGDDTNVENETPTKPAESSRKSEDDDEDDQGGEGEKEDEDQLEESADSENVEKPCGGGKGKEKNPKKTDDADEDDQEDAEEKAFLEKMAEAQKTFVYPKKFVSLKELKEITKCGFLFADDGQSFVIHQGVRSIGGSCGHDHHADEVALVKGAFGETAGSNPDFRPTDNELSQILAGAPNKGGGKYGRDAFKVYYLYAADTYYDRHNTRFAIRALKSGKRTVPDQAGLKNHDYENVDGVWARFFDAKVGKDKAGGHILFIKAAVRDKAKNADLIDDIESGQNNKLSIGARIKNEHFVCDICNVPIFGEDFQWCGHFPGWKDEKTGALCTATYVDMEEFLECSLVTIPAQRRAAIRDVDSAETYKSVTKGFTALNADEPAIIPMENTTKGETVVDELLKLLKEMQETNKALVEANTSVCNEMKALVEAQKTIAAEIKEATDKKEAVLQETIKEVEGRFNVLFKAHEHIAKQTGILLGRDITQIERTVALTKAMPQTRLEEHRKLQGDDNYFHNFADETYSDDELKRFGSKPITE